MPHDGVDAILHVQVFERGVEAIALSVDIWMHYIKFATTSEPENKDAIRRYHLHPSLSHMHPP